MNLTRTFLVTLLFALSGFIASAQILQTLCSFNITIGGVVPSAALTLGKDGNFYGTTEGGGSGGYGTVFKVTPNGTLTTLYSFNGNDGAYPAAPLTLGNDGNFYGTTGGGAGSGTEGTVFQLATNGTLTNLVTFNFTNGVYPNGLTLGSDGNFYGTTEGGGSGPDGTVFQLTTNGALTTLYDFTYDTGDTNGAEPLAPLTLGNDGNFYGTTEVGGITTGGTVFKVTPNGSLTTLADFNYPGGSHPSGLTLGNDGNFYGTTEGGHNYGQVNYGTVFQLTTNGSLTTLVYFNGTNGAEPVAALTLGKDGNFYGTTSIGGDFNKGTIFRVTTNGTLTTLVSFCGTNGDTPNGLTLDNNGNFYGTTGRGGSSDWGTVFSLTFSPIIPPTQPRLALQFLAGYPLLTLYGTLGDTYTIQCTTNLAVPNWTSMLIVPNLSISPFQMIDPTGIGLPARFYRALQQ